MVWASALQLVASMLALFRAGMMQALPRWTTSKPSNDNVSIALEPWALAVVLVLDVANDWGNRAINAHLPAPGGPLLSGVARITAHLGLAVYAAWVCGILAFVGLIARRFLPRFGVAGAIILWSTFTISNVLFYEKIRGDVALKVLGVVHCIAFVCELPCLVFIVRFDKRLTTERVCAVWLVFLGVAAGIGPLRPWDWGAVDRGLAENALTLAMGVLYASIIVTILAGASWSGLLRYCGLLRLRFSAIGGSRES